MLCLVLSCVLSCLVLSCPVLSCLALCCVVLCCVVLSSLILVFIVLSSLFCVFSLPWSCLVMPVAWLYLGTVTRFLLPIDACCFAFSHSLYSPLPYLFPTPSVSLLLSFSIYRSHSCFNLDRPSLLHLFPFSC